MKTGWVVKSKVNGKYYGDKNGEDGVYCSHNLKDAYVVNSRCSARNLKSWGTPKNETVCQVALSKYGIPYKVLKTGQ